MWIVQEMLRSKLLLLARLNDEVNYIRCRKKPMYYGLVNFGQPFLPDNIHDREFISRLVIYTNTLTITCALNRNIHFLLKIN